MMLEKFIPFKMEVSVIAARNTKGQIKTFPLVENIHYENIFYVKLLLLQELSQEVSKKSRRNCRKNHEGSKRSRHFWY